MIEHMKNLGYVFDPSSHIWLRPSFSGILYNDGDTVEQNIANIIKQVSDITVFSTELRQHCIDARKTWTQPNMARRIKYIA